MQRAPQMHKHDNIATATADLEAVYFKADQQRKNWPIFILMISLLEVSIPPNIWK